MSNPLDDEDRFKSIIDAALAAGDVEPFSAYQIADARQGKERRRRAEKEREEAEDYAKELGVHDALFGNGRPEGKEKKGLADLINQRQKARAATFLDDLTAKYVNGDGECGVRKGKKRKSEELEDENPPSNGRSRKKGKLTRGGMRRGPRTDQHKSESDDHNEVHHDKQPADEPPEEAFQEGMNTCILPFLAAFFVQKQPLSLVGLRNKDADPACIHCSISPCPESETSSGRRRLRR